MSILLILYYQAEKTLYRNLQDQITDLSKVIQVGVEEVTGASDEKRLKAYLAQLRSKGIKEISIISNTDEIVASTNPEKIGSPINPRKKEMIIKAELGEPVTAEGKTYNVIIPVITNNEHYGYLHLKINTEDFSKMLRSNLYKRIFVTLVIFLSGTIIIVFLSAQYTRPIQDIIIAVRKIMAGDYNYSLTVNSSGEVGELSKNIERMARILGSQQKLQENLRKAEHLAIVGQFAREVAHEVRNPLNFINLTIDHVRARLSHDSAFQKEIELLDTVKKEVHRLDGLVNNFLEYARPLRVNKKETNLGILFREIIDLIRTKAYSTGIQLRTDFLSLPSLMIDADLFKTSLMNIIGNSFESMPSGGLLSIRTWNEDKNYFIEISDTGEGISEEDLGKVFDPFFTTKQYGLGLGLSTAKRIIEEHGGSISVKSKKGEGTTVRICLSLTGVNGIPKNR
ncbi:MAG: sensor histidine kinase [Thermodesulfovibrionales bacterium]